jgi:hypothetical protein
MICLANSIREGDRCVAGIDSTTGNWIRPVPPGGGGIPSHCVFFGAHFLQTLDIVELNIVPQHFITKYQRENCVMPAYDWQIVGKAVPARILPFCDFAAPILHTDSDRVAPALLDAVAPAQWKSLQLIRATQVEFGQDYWNRKRWRASFKCRGQSLLTQGY